MNLAIWKSASLLAVTVAVALSAAAGFSSAQEAGGAKPAGAAPPSAEDVRAPLDRALAYLKSQQQPDGSWQRNPREPIAVTALVLRAFALDEKTGPKADFVKKGYAWLLAQQQPDGGIYKEGLANYTTAIAVSALAAANDPAYKPAIDKAVGYLKAAQFTDKVAGPRGEKIDPNHPYYGGWGYGGQRSPGGGRPDLSNTNVVLDALNDAGLPKDDPAFQQAMKFVQRLQNNSETNPLPWAGDDGGFVYGISDKAEGQSAAGEYQGPDGRPMARSYGSMTYGGLKSMIYAGLSRDDPRVKGAWSWIRKNWTLDENPGMRLGDPKNAEAGLFYYYQTFAKALAAYGEPTVTDAKGAAHDWRAELVRELKERQKPDGSFVGTNKWMEDNPVLSTTFAVLALQDAVADLKQRAGK